MEIMQGTYKGKEFNSADVQSNFGNSVTISLHGALFGTTKFNVPMDIDGLALINQEERWSIGMLFLIAILAISIVGLILAIPMLFFAKQQENLCRFTTPEGVLEAKADKGEWKKLSRFVLEPTRGEVACPNCGETILAKAKVCRHCGLMFL